MKDSFFTYDKNAQDPVSSQGVKSKLSLWHKEQYGCFTGQFSDKII